MALARAMRPVFSVKAAALWPTAFGILCIWFGDYW